MAPPGTFYAVIARTSTGWWSPTSDSVIARVGTPFDDPDHPYGQWTVKLTKVVPNVAASVDSVMVTAQFLVDAAPLERLIPGMRLGLFYGVTTLGELVVIDVASWFKGDADGKG